MFASVAAAVVLAVGSSGAFAGKPGPNPCASGTLDPSGGPYGSFTVTGTCTVPDSATAVTIDGNLTLADGASFDAVHNVTVNVTGNIKVGKGATLGLGCTPNVNDPAHGFTPCDTSVSTQDTVGGNIVANQPLTMYLDGDTVQGNVVSNGGGAGTYTNFAVKDNMIDGNLILHGWQGVGWWGVIRTIVGGNVDLANNSTVGQPDSSEVALNTISGNLICQHNSPAVQLGDFAAGAPFTSNVVTGNKIGECALNGV